MPTLSSETVAADVWCRLIVARCGLTFRDAQIPVVLGIVREQMQAGGLTSERSYYDRLVAAPEGGPEWAALIGCLLNHETSFFRHQASFDLLRTHILPTLREPRGRRLNLWSAGCSTGQEAYSIAMTAMADEDLRGEFAVWGGDFSRQAIEVARAGRYGPRAIAGIPPAYRRRFLRTIDVPGGVPEYEIAESLRQRVRFTTTNLLASRGVNLSYDVIFCQNVLIYFSPAAVSQVVASLATRLAIGGYLLLGPGEGPGERPPGLETLTVNGVRAFRRKCHTPSEGRPC